MGCDLHGRVVATVQGLFQSTHPSGVRHMQGLLMASPALFQSTHPSGVRRDGAFVVHVECEISIHAPQWGATQHRSNPTPERRNFNPRTPVGCDLVITILRRFWLISIHAPQWGATRTSAWSRRYLSISIHAPQWGATTKSLIISGDRVISIHAPQWGATSPTSWCCFVPLFQSTHPSGVRHDKRLPVLLLL